MTRIALVGDLMLGRGIDQIQRHSVSPALFEPAVRDARDYVLLAERRSGAIPEDVPGDYVWGDALESLRKSPPQVVFANLETALTLSDDCEATKGIHYRSHPENVNLLLRLARGIGLSAERIAVTLANNHILDWGKRGLIETIETLTSAGISHAGAGASTEEAQRPASIATSDGGHPSFTLISACLGDSGVPAEWAADAAGTGVFRLKELGDRAFDLMFRLMAGADSEETVRVVSLHWGTNWGHAIEESKRDFAHRLIKHDVADIIFGHSSHHPRALEIVDGKPIFYGVGDFVNDYEGIRGHEEYRPNLTLLHLLEYDAPQSGSWRRMYRAPRLRLVPFRLEKMRLVSVSPEERTWLAETITRENRRIGGPSLSVNQEGLVVSSG